QEDEEFMLGEYSSLFINGAFGTTPTVGSNLAAPIFPISGPGIRLRTDPVDFFYFQTAVYDGNVSAQQLTHTGRRPYLSRHADRWKCSKRSQPGLTSSCRRTSLHRASSGAE